MVNWKTGVVILAALVGLAVYAYTSRPQAHETSPAPFLPCDQYNAIYVELSAGSKSLVLDRAATGNAWRLEQPVQQDADENQVHLLLGRISALVPDSSVNNPGDPAKYGLSAPSRKLTCRVSRGSSYTLSIGDQSFDGNGYYAQKAGEAKLYVISGQAVDQFDQALASPPVRPSPGASVPSPSP